MSKSLEAIRQVQIDACKLLHVDPPEVRRRKEATARGLMEMKIKSMEKALAAMKVALADLPAS